MESVVLTLKINEHIEKGAFIKNISYLESKIHCEKCGVKREMQLRKGRYNVLYIYRRYVRIATWILILTLKIL